MNDLPQLPAPIRWLLSGLVRHILVGLGTALIARGVITQDQNSEFLNWGVSTALVVGGLIWSYLNTKAQSASNSAGK